MSTERAADYLIEEMGAEEHVYQAQTLTAITEPMEIVSPEHDRVIEEAISLHLEKAIVSVPVSGREIELDGNKWEVVSVNTMGVILEIGLVRYGT